MLNTALKLIKKIEEHGYTAYIVGGFVRDQLLNIPSNDIDICTSARPSDIRNIFPNSCLPNEAYGSVTVIIKNIRFEITTFRKEIRYLNNRKPIEFEYIDNLLEKKKINEAFLLLLLRHSRKIRTSKIVLFKFQIKLYSQKYPLLIALDLFFF